MITIKFKIKEEYNNSIIAAVKISKKEKAIRATKREIRAAEEFLKKIDTSNKVEFLEEDPIDELLDKIRKRRKK